MKRDSELGLLLFGALTLIFTLAFAVCPDRQIDIPTPTPLPPLVTSPGLLSIGTEAQKALRFLGDGHPGATAFPVARVGELTACLTARHVLEMAPLPWALRALDGTIYPMVGAEQGRYDVGIVWVIGKLDPVILAPDEVAIGDVVVAVGYPKNVGLVLTLGLAGTRDDENNLIATSAIFYGNSGGPLFRLDGRCVGIASMIYVDPNSGPVPHLAYFVPVVLFRDWLAESLTRVPSLK